MKIFGLNMVQPDSKASYLLDLLRFFSAFMVLAHHLYSNLNVGYQFVMVFFVLSGYFITSTVLKSIKDNRWSWKTYLINRVTRLWVVLLPALVLTWIWAYLQIHFFGHEEFFDGNLNWKVFLGNLFFLQSILVPVFGSNGPLWSLNFEFWYYILFPCLVLMFHAKKPYIKIMYGLLFVLTSFFVGEYIMKFFSIWLLGSLVAILKPVTILKKSHRTLFLLCSAALVLFSLKGSYILYGVPAPKWTDEHFLPDISVGISFAIVLYLIISIYNQSKPSSVLLRKASLSLAGFSYTLYLMHYPILNFVRYVRASIPMNKLIVAGLLMLFILVYSWVIAQITEEKTKQVRDFILKLVPNRTILKKPVTAIQSAQQSE